MQLKLRNIAKIKESTIDIDGITVIAGEDNTGKSTIGKILFTAFNSMNNMESKILNKKQSQIENIILFFIQNSKPVPQDMMGIEYRSKYRSWVTPYYLDMTSSTGHTIESLLSLDKTIDKWLYIHWRVFGFFNYMWNDVCDEGLVHSNFRELLWL